MTINTSSTTPSLQVLKTEKRFNNIPIASFFKQVWLLMVRDIVGWYRVPRGILTKIARLISGSTILSILYWDLPHTMRGAQDLCRLIFFECAASLIQGLVNSLLFVPGHRRLMEHERSVKTYSTSAWLLSKLLFIEAIIFIESCIFALIITYGVFHSTWTLELAQQWIIITFLARSATSGFGMFLCCFANDLADCVSYAPIFTPMLLLNNISFDMSRTYKLIRYLSDGNYINYVNNALLHVSFKGRTVEINEFMTLTGEQYLNHLHISLNSFLYDINSIAVFCGIFYLLAWIRLSYKHGC